MSTDIFSVEPTASLSDVTKVMEGNGIRRIPVIESGKNGQQRCVGMVTLDDLIASEAVNGPQLGAIVRAQIRRRAHSPRSVTSNDSRREQIYNRFIKVMAKNLELPKETADQVTYHLLKLIVQRLAYTNAANFIAQLPSLIHEDLLSLPAGPDVKITADRVLSELQKTFRMNKTQAKETARNFWRGLAQTLDSGILRQVLTHLPLEIAGLFSDVETGSTRTLVRETFISEQTVL
jgi:uncharacterized protein (DUF2267 family)